MYARLLLDVEATIHDPIALIERAREVVRKNYDQDDWEDEYPEGPSDALALLLREAIADASHIEGIVELHTIESLTDFELPPLP